MKLTIDIIKQRYNDGNEESKLIKAALALDGITGECDEYLESLIEEFDLNFESIDEVKDDLDDLSLYYKEEAIHNFKDSEFWDPSQWDEDEETWIGTEEEYKKLLTNILEV